MNDVSWTAEFTAKELSHGRFAPMVKLRRTQGSGPQETSLTFSGVYDTHDGAARVAQDLYARIGGHQPGG